MKLRFVLLIVPFVLLAADGKKTEQKKTDGKSAQAALAAAPAAGIKVPDGATPLGDGSWRYTDPAGQTSIYRETPFGIARYPEEKKPAAVEEIPAGMKAAEAGGPIRFERSGPFGPIRWSRTKDQMSDLERRVWERDCGKTNSAPATSGAPKE